MGADDDIDGALGETLLGLRQFLRAHQPRGLAHRHRQALEARCKITKMLPSQQRRWHHHRDLNAVKRGNESRADRDFGFAETDIAADQAVHGATSC